MVSEKTIHLNTGEGTSTVQTEHFKGKLDAIIIDAEARVEVLIESELGYNILHSHEIFGVQYLPIRVNGVDNKHHQAGFSFDKYYLNEALTITIVGQRGKKVNFTFRFD